MFGSLANTTASANLTLADSLCNDSEKRLLSTRDWPFLWRQYTIPSVASTVTVTIATPGVFTLSNHGFSIGTALYFATTGALPTGLTAGTVYYVIAAGLTANAFEVSTQINGSAVATSGTQSGTHTVLTQRYMLPAYISKPQSVYVTVGSYRYVPIEVTNRLEWDKLNEVQISSNIVTHYFVYDGAIEIFPRQSSSNVITFNARRIAKDLSIADYTTGTVDIVTYGSTLVTGSGTSWSTPMAGRWIKITPGNTASSSGDGYWYEIDAVTSSTTLILRKAYLGTSLTTGASAAYTIGEVSLIPEPHDQIPVFEALKFYFTSVDPDATKAKLYATASTELQVQMFKDYTSKTNVVLDSGDQNEVVNPNLLISY
jgi:hypothetical protein